MDVVIQETEDQEEPVFPEEEYLPEEGDPRRGSIPQHPSNDPRVRFPADGSLQGPVPSREQKPQ